MIPKTGSEVTITYKFLTGKDENGKVSVVNIDNFTVTETTLAQQQQNALATANINSNNWTRSWSVPNKHLYNGGGELNEQTKNYETFYRPYDPAIGRFTQVDIMAAKYSSMTPYNYAFNDPIALNDPSGVDPYDWDTPVWVGSASYLQAAGGYQGDGYLASRGQNVQSYGGNHSGGSGSLADIVSNLYNSTNGGSWNASDGYSYFVSNYEALTAGIAYVNQHNSWGYTAYGSSHATSVAYFSRATNIGSGLASMAASYNIGDLSASIQATNLNFNAYDFSEMNRQLAEWKSSGNISMDGDGSIGFLEGNTPTPWVDVAESQLGVVETSGKGNTVKVLQYLYSTTTGVPGKDSTPWCAAFCNWSLEKAGIRGRGSASAIDWSSYGRPVVNPGYGSIAVINWGKGKGHVGFVVGMNTNGSYILLGGNQNDRVSYSSFSRNLNIQFYHPYDYKINYNLPNLNIFGNTNARLTR